MRTFILYAEEHDAGQVEITGQSSCNLHKSPLFSHQEQILISEKKKKHISGNLTQSLLVQEH